VNGHSTLQNVDKFKNFLL